MNESASHKWHELLRLIEEKSPEDFQSLNPPATEQDYQLFETEIGFPFPDQAKEIYSVSNGVNPENGAILGTYMFSIKDIIAEWRTWKLEKEKPGPDLDRYITSYPADAIKKLDWNPRWVPIFVTDENSNAISIDLDPGPSGNTGQIINTGRDEVHKFVIAHELAGFLRLVVDHLVKGDSHIDEYGSLRPFKGDMQLIDALRQTVTSGPH